MVLKRFPYWREDLESVHSSFEFKTREKSAKLLETIEEKGENEGDVIGFEEVSILERRSSECSL